MHKVEQGQEVRIGGKVLTEGMDLPLGRNYAGLVAAGKVIEIKEKIVVRSVPATEKPTVVESTEEPADAKSSEDDAASGDVVQSNTSKRGGRRGSKR